MLTSDCSLVIEMKNRKITKTFMFAYFSLKFIWIFACRTPGSGPPVEPLY